MYQEPELTYGGEWGEENREDFPGEVTFHLKRNNKMS